MSYSGVYWNSKPRLLILVTWHWCCIFVDTEMRLFLVARLHKFHVLIVKQILGCQKRTLRNFSRIDKIHPRGRLPAISSAVDYDAFYALHRIGGFFRGCVDASSSSVCYRYARLQFEARGPWRSLAISHWAVCSGPWHFLHLLSVNNHYCSVGDIPNLCRRCGFLKGTLSGHQTGLRPEE